MGIIGMKIPSRGRLLAGFTPPPEGSPLRRPQDKGAGTLKMHEALRYALSLPVSTVIVGCDSVAGRLRLSRPDASRRTPGRCPLRSPARSGP